VNWILLDGHGYLWVATVDGLGRYDGYRFQVYRNNSEDEASLSSNDVRTLFEDRSGNLWVGTNGGLNRFDWKTEKFRRYLYSAHDDNSISSDSITTIGEDGKGELWIGTKAAGLNTFNAHKNNFTRVVLDTSARTVGKKTLCDNRVRAIIRDHKGVLWIGTRGGWLHRLDPVTNEFDCYRSARTHTDVLDPDGVRALCEDHSGNIWLGTFEAGIKKFDPMTRKFETFIHRSGDPTSLSNNAVNQLLVDRTGDLWIATFNGGLDRRRWPERKFKHYVNNPKDPVTLSSDNVTSLCEDQSGTVWVGTAVGLDKYVAGMNIFRHFSHDPDDPKSLSNNFVASIKEDRSGNLWVATFGGGLNQFDPATGVFEHFLHSPRDAGSICSNYVTGLCVSRSGSLWIGTMGGGLDKLAPGSRKFQHYPKTRSDTRIRTIYEDGSGLLWYGTYSAGLKKFNPRTNQLTHFFQDPNNPHSVTSNVVWEFEVDTARKNEGLLWIAANHGFTRCDMKREKFQQFFPDTQYTSRSNNIMQTHQDHSGTLWLATLGGLWGFEPKTGAFEHFTSKDGLANDLVWNLEEDDHGRLWIATGSGLSRFDPRTKQFRNYDAGDGLQGIRFNYGCHSKLRSGELCFGSTDGFTMFHPDSVKENTHVPPIVIAGFRKFNKPVDIREAVGQSGAVELSYKENMFSFEFAALDFVRPEENQYAYKLEGFDKDWVYCGTRRSATYTNLDGGEYVFRVKGANNDGVWNEEGASMAVIITPPFWATWWFRIPAMIALLGIVGKTVRYVEKRKLMRRIEQLELEQALVNERARISQDMHDEIGSSLSEIAILGELARKKPEEAERYIQQISERAAEVIDSVSEIVWAMNPSYDTLDSLVARMRRDAVKYLGFANISCRFAAPDVVPILPLRAELRRNLFLVVKEALHNIVKHSAATEVSISVRCMKGDLEILVSDNGKGFVLTDRLGTGNGLSSMHKRIADMGGTLRIDSTPGRGTLVAVQATLATHRPTDLPNSKYWI
jgi:ligand-binding sensor domain-containing protein/signal transduction histidine kinase